MSPTSLLLKWYLTPQSAMSQPANLQGIHSRSLLDWSKEIRHKMCRSISLGPKQLWWGARTVRAIGHLDVSGEGAHVFFNTFLVCVLVVCGPSKACHPRQEPLLPRYRLHWLWEHVGISVWVPHFQVSKCSLLHLGRDGERHFYPVNLSYSTHLERMR